MTVLACGKTAAMRSQSRSCSVTWAGRKVREGNLEVVSRLKLENEWDVKEANLVSGTESSTYGSQGTGKGTGP